jgi:APA family basic amino acid/polyamine antiporter
VAYRTPSAAIALQAAMAVAILFVLGSFERALDYTTFAILLATIADVAALYALRRSQPERVRPYRAWGYPWVPAAYVVATASVAGALLWERPEECAYGLALAAIGIPFYLVFARRSRTLAPPEEVE